MFNPTHKRRILMRAMTMVPLLFAMLFILAIALEPIFAKGRDHTGDLDQFDGTYSWETLLTPPASASDYITYTDYREDFCLYATTPTACATAASGKYIRFDTAEELYRFSQDVSFEAVYQSGTPAENYKLSVEKITLLLSLHYTLGADIDYAVMGAKTFIPIGHWFTDVDNVLHKNIFSGTFDGRGFTIYNLYLAGYDDMIYVDYVDETTTIDIAVAHYYSMFTYNEGTIENLGLVNPTLELLDVHIDLNMTSNLVGLNAATGVVDHVFVVDTRTSVTDAGIRYKVGTATGTFTAAGVVHTNEGVFTNAYYSSKVVVNGSYINKFIVQPVIYQNNTGGTYSNLVYDSTVYLLAVVVGTSTFYVATPNAYAAGETTSVLKSSSSSLNSLTDRWYFYASDCYPQLLGLTWNDTGDYYEIDDAIDLLAFSQIIEYATVENGVSYPAAEYRLTADIDMSEVTPNAYKTPSVNFTGIFSGQNGTTLDDNFYIYNFHMINGIIRETNYYAGLFSIVSGGTVHDLNVAASSVTITDSETYYSNVFGIGMVAGRMIGGTMYNIQLDVAVNLGTTSIGETHLGMLVGRASGTIDQVSVSGTLDAGVHVFQPSLAIAPKYYIGGIVGSATVNQLAITDSVNNADISGFSTTSTFGMATGNYQIFVKLGGIIGYMINTSSVRNQLVGVANKGDLAVRAVTTANDLSGNVSLQSVGGVFGELSGYAPILESAGVYLFANLYNSGIVSAAYGATRAQIRAAGIGTSNTSQSAEYALCFNHAGFTYDSTGFSGNTHFRYTGTIMDISAYNAANTITLSRSYNYADFTFATAYYITFSPLYLSINENNTIIRYSANEGDLTYINNAGATTITMGAAMTVTGITASLKVDYRNVTNKGNITLVNINLGANALSIGGLTNTVTSGKYMVNCLNEGNITFGQMTGTGNIYVGGLATNNYSGDLWSQDASNQPIATIGVINSLNYGIITTSYGTEGQNLYAVDGLSNTFVGGIVGLNSGSIQDCANLSHLKIFNSSTAGATNIATGGSTSTTAGRVDSYTAGVTIGGIAAVILAGTSRIYDTANIGDIVAMSYRYARAGGILATCLYSEAWAGGITGLTNDANIRSSALANGLNYASVAAFTWDFGKYITTQAAYDMTWTTTVAGTVLPVRIATSRVGTADRPGIFSAAGGIIGYGLCTMKRMINHGTIAATDVAGGIVGATFVMGGAGVTTTVYINTAINYGLIKAARYNKIMADADSINGFTFAYDVTNTTIFYPDGDAYIFGAETAEYRRMAPANKRGFGGIFGRLQRGYQGVMTSESGGSFDFVVNTNPAIDLVGRLDQINNFYTSMEYFRFYNALYYTANANDSTQYVFTGFYFVTGSLSAKVKTTTPFTYNVSTVSARHLKVGLNTTSGVTIPGLTVPFTTHLSATNITAFPATRLVLVLTSAIQRITENPSDACIAAGTCSYFYSPTFEMRTNPALTQYIYYLEYNLLADRFKTGGATPRPNGMYVLSTSAGSSLGLVIPSNITPDDIRLINEDYTPPLSLLMNYGSVSPSYVKALTAGVTTAFNGLKQSTFNDKSSLVSETTSTIVLDETGGSNTLLTVPTVNHTTKVVAFTVSMEAFTVGQTTVAYAVTNAAISAYALIAKRAIDQYGGAPTQAQLNAYNNLLYPERANGISTAYPPTLTVALPSRDITVNTTVTIGYFGVFSEAFVGSDLFANANYYTDYRVDITFTPRIGVAGNSIQIATVQFNGGGAVSVTNQADVTALGSVSAAGSVRFNFTYTAGLLATGYDFKDMITVKYHDGTVVNPAYYTLTTVPAAGGTYAVTITFSNATRSGNYAMYYKYFSTSTELNVLFHKAASTATAITDLDYYSEDGSTVYNGATITGAANVGYDPGIGINGTTNFTSDTDPGIASYLDGTTYLPDFMTTASFVIAPFATLTNVYMNQVTITAGYKTFDIVYVVTAEDGTTATTYHHYITGREIDLVSVLKNGNEVFLDNVFAVREDAVTTFTVDLGLDQILELYSVISGGSWSYFGITVTATELDGVTPIAAENIVGLTYDTNDYLLIYMSFETIPGIYTFAFVFYRDGQTSDYITIATTLKITKNAGTDPFLSDIRFSELANETSYPAIGITEADGDFLTGTGYDPLVYFGGIDYDGADLYPYYFYRVDGQVSNTPLDSYMPYVLDYLPYGGSIQRRVYDFDAHTWSWSAAVGADGAGQSALLADFTLDPGSFTADAVTGFDPTKYADLVVMYKITAEDGLHYTYYFVTVTDVVYNVTLVFDVYYCTGAGYTSCTLAKESAGFDNELVIITVRNYATDGDDTVIGVTDPAFYPHFSAILGLNNRVTQFHYTYNGTYRYSFGRNISGFYTFAVALPQDQYLNALYEYQIEFSYGVDDYILNDAADYVAGLEGKYFYIESSTRNRTRRFNIYIQTVATPTTDAPWGLFDFFRSWWD